MRELFKVILSQSGPFKNNPITEFFTRVEFQHRGSPHIHSLLWAANAPNYDPEDLQITNECLSFIDKYITCSSSHEFASFQKHKHTYTCKKMEKNTKLCRFGLPAPPMKLTKILLPLEEEEKRKEFAEQFIALQSLLKEIDRGKVTPKNFSAFLELLKIQNEEDYILLLRSSIKRPTIFIRRDLSDLSINAYNSNLLSLSKSNIDIQFVLDAYACVQYILNYINKSDRGLSKLLRESLDQSRKGNASIKERLRSLGNTFLNSNEVSAQEAIYLILGMPLSRCSRSTVYINTSPPNERVRLAKTRAQLQSLPEDSTEVFATGLIEHYVARPLQLNEICLADFASYYTFHRQKNKTVCEAENEDEEETLEITNNNWLPLRDGSGYVHRQNRGKIIRYRNFSKESESYNFYRENIMLFLPWMDEVNDILKQNVESKYQLHEVEIKTKAAEYNASKMREALSSAMQEAQNAVFDETEKMEQVLENDFEIFRIGCADTDIFANAGEEAICKTAQNFQPARQVPHDEFLNMVRSLNVEQRQYFLHAVHSLKTRRTFHEFVTGGAGTGKSHLIKTIYQACIRHFSGLPGADPDKVSVILCAPTGKAAYNIGGATLHSVFHLPVSQYSHDMPELSAEMSNTLCSHLMYCKLIIIDEISMVGLRQFYQIDKRLKQIFKSEENFGGVSILCFGDFHQLKPVGDSHVFSSGKMTHLADLGPSLWDNFCFYELTTIMRQQENLDFAHALNRLASGTMTTEDIALMRSCEVNENRTVPPSALHLFRTNAESDRFNDQRIQSAPGNGIISSAIDTFSGEASKEKKDEILRSFASKTATETLGLPSSLILKHGVRYMLRLNIDTSDGLVNGAVGVLRRVDTGNHTKLGTIPLRVWMEFEDGNTGRNCRSAISTLMKDRGIPPCWTPVERACRQLNTGKRLKALVLRKQFPLVPAEGITIHKSQGSTYTEIALHLHKGMDRASLYVACSRVTNCSGLFIVGNFQPPPPPPLHHPVRQELLRLKTKCRISLMHSYVSRAQRKIFFHNVQSLRNHHKDLICDQVILKADIILTVENWSFKEEKYPLEGYKCIQRIDNETCVRKAVGSTAYVKQTALARPASKIATKSPTGHLEVLVVEYEETYIVSVYRSPKFSLNDLFDCLTQMMKDFRKANFIILGDFNIDWKTHSRTFHQWMTAFNLRMVLAEESSTNYDTQLDLCFTNIESISAYYYESVTSFHKPIWVLF
ncbi:uncharacterized protein LOC129220608 [Uloborus diversus]|uniref:uncharacterized protein LOC129220608 n=1 Tax=Uloborus diversus TaxID=327109 RepID=UPI0024097A51|nr:uncharacterized protein LOC129220608 [Uloborus diversus]